MNIYYNVYEIYSQDWLILFCEEYYLLGHNAV
jgi:hypothetical protein